MSRRPLFLIIRFSSFGDITQSLSIPSAIRATYPDAEVHWITRKDMAPLLQHHPAIDRIWAYDRKTGLKGLFQLLSQMSALHFDYIYDAHNNLRSRFVYWRVGLFRRSHFIRRSPKRWKRFLLFRFRINTYEQPFSGQRDLLEPLAPWNIAKSLPPPPQLFIDADEEAKARSVLATCQNRDFVALAPSAAHFLKRWPQAHFQELIRLLPSTFFVLLGGPEDVFMEDIAKVAPERILNLAGKCSLTTSSAVVKKAKVLVSNDTGLLHVGEQLGKATVALMGPAPFGFPSRPSTKIMQLDLPCRPCSKHGQKPCVNPKFHQCLVDITPAQVAAEVQRLWPEAR